MKDNKSAQIEKASDISSSNKKRGIVLNERFAKTWCGKALQAFSVVTVREGRYPIRINMSHDIPMSKIFGENEYCYSILDIETAYHKLKIVEKQIFTLYVQGQSVSEISMQKHLTPRIVILVIKK